MTAFPTMIGFDGPLRKTAASDHPRISLFVCPQHYLYSMADIEPSLSLL